VRTQIRSQPGSRLAPVCLFPRSRVLVAPGGSDSIYLDLTMTSDTRNEKARHLSVTGSRLTRSGPAAHASGGGRRRAATVAYLPSFLRCTRVRRSSLRCFFLDIRLRRFLITEPIGLFLAFSLCSARTPVYVRPSSRGRSASLAPGIRGPSARAPPVPRTGHRQANMTVIHRTGPIAGERNGDRAPAMTGAPDGTGA